MQRNLVQAATPSVDGRGTAHAFPAGMSLGISNIVIGFVLLMVALWQRTHDGAPSIVTAFIVAGAGAVWVGIYQLWRHRYVYNSQLDDDF